MYRAVVFDCFGVLFPDPVLEYMRQPGTPAPKAASLHALDEQAARGRLSKQGFITAAAELLEQDKATTEQQFFYGAQPNTDLLQYVLTLRKNYKTALLSNIGADMMDGFFSPADLQRYFDVAVLSGAVGIAKPERAIFDLTLAKLGVRPGEAIFIDDLPGNCEAAAQIGMQAIRYTGNPALFADLARLTTPR